MATDEICLHKTLEGIKKLVSDAGGKILAEDFKIISQLQESFREVVKAHSSEGSDFIKNVLRHLITKTDYIFFTAKSAILASEAEKMTKSEVPLKVPRLFKPIIQKVEDHLCAVERAKTKVTNLYQVLRTKVDEAPQVNYKLSREYLQSLEIKKDELDGELNIWKCYIEDTERVLTEFDKEIKEYLSRESYKSTWMIGFFVVGATVFTGGAGAIASGVSAIAAAGIGAAPLIGGGLAALLFGAAVSVTGICLVLRGWLAKRNFCNKLLQIHQNYSELVGETQRIAYSNRFN